jgi:hypothetical protein
MDKLPSIKKRYTRTIASINPAAEALACHDTKCKNSDHVTATDGFCIEISQCRITASSATTTLFSPQTNTFTKGWNQFV